MAKHHPDLILRRKQAGVAIGRLCGRCDGKCVVCESYVRPCGLVLVCDQCNYGSYQGRCLTCGGPGLSDSLPGVQRAGEGQGRLPQDRQPGQLQD